MESFMLFGFSIYAWITIVTVLTMFTVLLLTKLRTDLVFLGAIAILYVTGVLDADGSAVDETALLVGFVALALLTLQLLDTKPATDVADDDILRTAQIQFAATYQDAIARCRLASNRHILQFDTNGTFVLTLRIRPDVDDAADTKHDGGIFPASLCQRPAQRSLAAVCQRRYLDHLAASSARGILAKTLSGRKRQRLRPRANCQ